MKVAQVFKSKSETQVADRRRPIKKWRIAHKLTLASVLMILLAMLSGGVGLWQVYTIDQAVGDARKREQQLARSLELLATGHKLVAALDRMFVAQNPLLASMDVTPSLGTLSFYMETLQKAGGETWASDILGEMQAVYSELYQVVNEVNLLARQKLWTEVGVALEQKVGPANEQMGLLIQRLVRRADRDVEAMTARTQVAVRQATLLLAALMVLTTAIALGWRQFVFRGLSLSTSELWQGVARISSGDLEYRLDIRTGDEIEELGDEFNKMTDELADVIGNLEKRVADRTADLQQRTVELEQLTHDLENAVDQSRRRALRLETAAHVARAAISVLDPDELLKQVVDLIADRVGFYHVGIFLLDETGQYAVLWAANSEGGQRMLARGHRLRVGEQGTVGYVTATGRPRITLDVGVDAIYFDNPDLPLTRSEMALPLAARGRILGALDVQSMEAGAFDDEDVAILGTLADQVAVALDNARLFEESRNALREIQRVQAQYIAQAWRGRQARQPLRAVEYTRPGVAPLYDQPLLEADRVAVTGETLVTASDDDGQTPASLVVPLKLYGRTIGLLGFQETEPGRVWTEDEIALAEAVADQIAQTLESARLFEEAQQRAWREQTVGQIAAQIRASTDVEDILQTVAEGLGRTLGVSRAIIRLSKGR